VAISIEYWINAGGIEPRTDGTGLVDHDLFAMYSLDDGDTWNTAYHHTVVAPGGEAQAIIDAGTGVKPAYKELLRTNWGTAPVQVPPPILGSGDPADLREYIVEMQEWQADRDAANEVAANAAAAVIDFVPEWPVRFEVG
jgi:hypothetical protein